VTGPRTARVLGGTETKLIGGVAVCYYDQLVFVDWRAARRERSTG